MVKIFFLIKAINYRSKCTDEFPYIEGHGFWREIPCVMPIGTVVCFESPYSSDEFMLTVMEYEVRCNGDIICRVDDECDGDEDGYVIIHGTREEVLKHMKTVGLVDYCEGKR